MAAARSGGFLDQLDEGAERPLRVDKGDDGSPGSGAWLFIDCRTTCCDYRSQSIDAVVDAVADVVEAFSSLFQEDRYRRIKSSRRGQLDKRTSDLQESLLDTVAVDDLAVVHLGSERPPVVVDGRL